MPLSGYGHCLRGCIDCCTGPDFMVPVDNCVPRRYAIIDPVTMILNPSTRKCVFVIPPMRHNQPFVVPILNVFNGTMTLAIPVLVNVVQDLKAIHWLDVPILMNAVLVMPVEPMVTVSIHPVPSGVIVALAFDGRHPVVVVSMSMNVVPVHHVDPMHNVPIPLDPLRVFVIQDLSGTHPMVAPVKTLMNVPLHPVHVELIRWVVPMKLVDILVNVRTDMKIQVVHVVMWMNARRGLIHAIVPRRIVSMKLVASDVHARLVSVERHRIVSISMNASRGHRVVPMGCVRTHRVVSSVPAR